MSQGHDWYVLDKEESLAAHEDVGHAYRDVIGWHFPAMLAMPVAGLMEDRAWVEIEVTAAIPQVVHVRRARLR